jgi:cytoskeleton protein RodZ
MANFASPPESRAADAPAARPRETVGDLLKRARVEQGAEIDQIAAALRIRASYVAAIEQARYDRLPGVVYALGFVRTYANHLGLDGDEAVRRFKLESAGLEQRQDLAFPMPLTARSMPGGKLVLVAIVLAVCAYGVWYYISTGERDRPERVAAVPTSLLPPPAPAPTPTAAPAQAAPGQAAPAAAASAPTAEGAAPSPAPVSTSPLPPPQAATAKNPTASQPGASLVAPPPPRAAPAPVQTAGLTPPPAPQAGEPAPPAPTTVAANPAPPADTDSNAAPAAATSASAPAEQPAPAQAVAAGAAAVPAVAAATPAAPSAPRVFGAIDGPSHITLHAVKDCWIQVRDSDPAQTVIAQRTLHAGDSYRVPDKTGLTLRTGNASVLQVLVDDRTAPALGGTVREIALDPTKLLAGDAVE